MDQLSALERQKQVQALGKAQQKKLFSLAKQATALDLDFFVPTQTPQQEVIHNGKNSLPVFSLFQKRFCRLDDGSNRVFGYNHGKTTAWIGPGYFVAKSTSDNPDLAQHGSVVIDYYEVPDASVVSSWPAIVPNDKGLQRFVYFQMQDFMRRVSQHVSIGIAFQRGKDIGQYFVLCREDVA